MQNSCAQYLCTRTLFPMGDNYDGLELDATAVRILAHPLRSRLLSRLRIDGPNTATTLAEALATNTGATSYHLRKLESVGLVTDTGEGEGKRRLWRASTTHHSFHRFDFGEDEDAATAAGWLERDYLRQFAHHAEDWLDASEEWPRQWADALGLHDALVTGTVEQLTALRNELDAVLTRYREAGAGAPEARRLSVFTYVYPTDLTAPKADPS